MEGRRENISATTSAPTPAFRKRFQFIVKTPLFNNIDEDWRYEVSKNDGFPAKSFLAGGVLGKSALFLFLLGICMPYSLPQRRKGGGGPHPR
jgi:hypothetical protein